LTDGIKQALALLSWFFPLFADYIWSFQSKSVILQHNNLLKSVVFNYQKLLKSVNSHAVQEDHILYW
jgi:hypothetical protein